jgi:hypothetical protein
MTERAFQTLGVLLLSATALTAGSSQRWIHVRVESARGPGGSLSFNVPIQMATAILPEVSGDQHHKFNFQASINGADLRAVLDAVHDSPDNTFVTIARHDREVTVAKSGQDLVIKIAEKPSAEHRITETIGIKVPIPVVRALLAEHSDELDVPSGIRALARQGEVEVTVNKEKETVRVWTDMRTTAD